jgi:hypothetical protein
MTREWNALAGCAPGVWIANELPNLQDYELAAGDDVQYEDWSADVRQRRGR